MIHDRCSIWLLIRDMIKFNFGHANPKGFQFRNVSFLLEFSVTFRFQIGTNGWIQNANGKVDEVYVCVYTWCWHHAWMVAETVCCINQKESFCLCLGFTHYTCFCFVKSLHSFLLDLMNGTECFTATQTSIWINFWNGKLFMSRSRASIKNHNVDEESLLKMSS